MAAGSGVKVADNCVSVFQDMKMKSSWKFIIYKISNDQSIIEIERSESKKSFQYQDFVALLPAEDCRYCVYDFPYKTKEGAERNKIVFIAWAPDRAKIKTKMLYAASKDAFKKQLLGLAAELQATDLDELSEASILEKVR
eukprot:CAMPEP_0196656216 /NCGR_PEP_ID=MMETSP1086-20130531/14045_1 /TAXON_ID=77921 /ORGANISM="Cyanoptyche  gloeocystis , Strain SAG4.97" /LENGTH=139 /DNA_ID=CAMNT_0041988865 /DNA_START=77 /DNA_END=496 /DNA_ORIENTATION=+